jgi:hypothetical protein
VVREAIAFYSKLFNTAPAKVKDGYANFAVAEPPLKLVLLQNPGKGRHHQPPRRRGGIQRASPCRDRPLHRRRGCSPMRRSAPRVASPPQDKVWVTGPSGEKWEVYTVLADSETFGISPQHNDTESTDATCCGGHADDEHESAAGASCC